MKYATIARGRQRYSIQMMCRLLEVSRSGYYAAKTRPESSRSKQDRELMAQIKRVHVTSGGVYGSPRVQAELAADVQDTYSKWKDDPRFRAWMTDEAFRYVIPERDRERFGAQDR